MTKRPHVETITSKNFVIDTIKMVITAAMVHACDGL